MNEELKKTCSKCHEEKTLESFGLDNRNKDRKNNYCKLCIKIIKKKYNDNNKEKIKISVNLYKEKNPEKVKQFKKAYKDNNPEKIKESNRNYRKNNPIKAKEIRENYKIRRNKRHKERKKNDPLYKLKCNVRGLIKKAFKDKGFKKNSKSHEILGCSFEEFKIYIENKFELWMNWENHGKYKKNTFNYGWDFDHKIPLDSAQTIEEVIKLSYYTNYQPLCSKVNRDVKNRKF